MHKKYPNTEISVYSANTGKYRPEKILYWKSF